MIPLNSLMFSQGANYTADFMVRGMKHRLEKERKNTSVHC